MAPLPSPPRATPPVRYELLQDLIFAPTARTCATSAGSAPHWKVALVVVHRPDSVGEEEVHRPDPDPPCTTVAPLPQCSTRCAATRIPVISRSNLRLALSRLTACRLPFSRWGARATSINCRRRRHVWPCELVQRVPRPPSFACPCQPRRRCPFRSNILSSMGSQSQGMLTLGSLRWVA